MGGADQTGRTPNAGTRLKCWDPLLWFWFHFESSSAQDLFAQLQFRWGQNCTWTMSNSYHQHVDKALPQNLDIFLLSCKHALIFCTLKVTDVSWIAYRLELVPFQSQGECSPDYNAHIYGCDLFLFFMLMISIFGTKLLLIMASSHSRVKKAGSRRKLLLQKAHTALHLCGLKIKLSSLHLRMIIFCRTSHLRLHSSTVYCKDVNKPASEAFTEIFH